MLPYAPALLITTVLFNCQSSLKGEEKVGKEMAHQQQKLEWEEKLHGHSSTFSSDSSPSPSPSSFPPSSPSTVSTTITPKASPPRRPRPRFVRPHPRRRLVFRTPPSFRFQCTAHNDTNDSFCHSKCPNKNRWTAGVRIIPTLWRKCPNGCGLCGNSTVCMDRDPRCRLFRGFCRGPFYSRDVKRIYCGRTCKLC